ADLIAELGGLHAFMGWDGPILTDSGGFQVFSLRDTIAAVDDEGVTFRSVYDGSTARFTPELVAEVQAQLGSDRAVCPDVCPPARRRLDRGRGGRTADDDLGYTAALAAARSWAAPVRDLAGRLRLRAAHSLNRGVGRARLRRVCARRALCRRAAAGAARDGRL